MHVCVCVCMHVCMHVSMYACTHVRMHVCMDAYMNVCTMRFFLKYNYIQVDNTCYKDLQTLAIGYKVEYVLYIFISPAIFFYLFLSFFALF